MVGTREKAIEKMFDINPERYTYAGWAYWVKETSPSGFTDYFLEVEVADDRFTEEQISDANERGRCEHCNHRISHFVVVYDEEAEQLLAIGLRCYQETFSHAGKEQLVQYRLEKLAKAKARRKRIALEVVEYSEEHPEEYAVISNKVWRARNRFLADLWDKLHQWGSLTDKQTAAIVSAVERWEKNEQIKADAPPASPAPTGRVMVVGTVISTKTVDDTYSYYPRTIKKMTVRSDEGFRFYCSVPSAIYDVDRGDRISLSIDLTPSGDDECFAWGKRPTKAMYIEESGPKDPRL